MFMRGVDRADKYLCYYSLLRKTVKWPMKVAFWLINYAFFNSFRIYQKLNPTSQMKYKEFLLQVARDWATDKVETDSDQTQTQHAHEHHTKPLVCLMRTPLGDFRVICGNMCYRKLLEVKGVKENILLVGAVFVLPTKSSKTRNVCKLCLVPLHKGECFQRCHTLQH